MGLKGAGARSLCYHVFRAVNKSSKCYPYRTGKVLAWMELLEQQQQQQQRCYYQGAHLPGQRSHQLARNMPFLMSSLAQLSTQGTQREKEKRELTTQEEDAFDDITDRIPQKPVTFVEGASYSVIILAGLAVAAAAAYAVFKELVFEPREYKVFNIALERSQHDNQVTVRIGSPITGYGQDSRNRAARQRIPHRVWTDEDGVERIEVQFHIRGPHGTGKVYCEMFKDKKDKKWHFTYLIVDIISPTPTRLMLESYVPS